MNNYVWQLIIFGALRFAELDFFECLFELEKCPRTAKPPSLAPKLYRIALIF